MGKQYQTSPYIYLINNFEKGKINILNLLTGVSESFNHQVIFYLQQLKNPLTEETIRSILEEELFQKLIKARILLPTNDLWKVHQIENIEIEVNTNCNWRCEYCPVHIDPLKKEIMPMDLFSDIIRKATEYDKIKNISLSAYNEPLLDPYFIKRLIVIKEAGFKLILHTNGSALNEDKIKYLKECGVLAVLHFNFPHLNKERFEKITASKSYEKVIKNIDLAIEAGLNIEFSIQKVVGYEENIKAMNEKYASRIGKAIRAWETVDRAGLLKNRYAQNIYNNRRLGGCKRFSKWMSIGVNGDAYICCHDYYKENVLGNINDGTLAEILSSERAQEIRKTIFGGNIPNKKFICNKCYEMDIFMTTARLSRSIRANNK